MTNPVRILSSMATRSLLTGLAAAFEPAIGVPIRVESIGGVDAAKRVRAGEAVDVVILASNVIDELIVERRLLAGSRVDLARSGVAVAVRAGAPRVAIDSEAAVRRAVEDATSVAYSTGPSGTHLARLFDRWGIAALVESRLVRPPPGVPVAQLIADGKVALGFQQTSELQGVDGVDVLGPLPESIQSTTIFSGGVSATASDPDAARSVLELFASPAADAAKRDLGMEPG